MLLEASGYQRSSGAMNPYSSIPYRRGGRCGNDTRVDTCMPAAGHVCESLRKYNTKKLEEAVVKLAFKNQLLN